MSPAGYHNSNSYIWQWENHGMIVSYWVNAVQFALRPIINLKSDTQASGTGTSIDPFLID